MDQHARFGIYCKFGNFREGFIFAKLRIMRSFVKIESSRNGEITLSFTEKVHHALVASFNAANMSFIAIRENKNSRENFQIYSITYMYMHKGLV